MQKLKNKKVILDDNKVCVFINGNKLDLRSKNVFIEDKDKFSVYQSINQNYKKTFIVVASPHRAMEITINELDRIKDNYLYDDIKKVIQESDLPMKDLAKIEIYKRIATSRKNTKRMWHAWYIKIGSKLYSVNYNKDEKRFADNRNYKMVWQYDMRLLNIIEDEVLND